jgi:ABC-2 family transporter protein
MRPYFAIIKDSFREALASRVLWVFTGLIVLLLLAIAPLGYKLNLTGEFTWGDIVDGPQLVERLRRDHAASQPSPGKRIWSLLDEETRKKLEKFEKIKEDEGREFFGGMEALRKGLNKLVTRQDFYQEEDWRDIPLGKEAKDFLAKGRESLAADEVARLNRLLIEAPYQAHFAWRSPQSISVTYFWAATDPLPFSKKQVDTVIKEWILTTTMGWIVGVFGMIAAILVTSTIIPQMFEPGSITLLLSKPVSRSLLLTAKFLGGCAFVFFNVALLIVGLWLIAGLRFGIWNRGMLWCIPIFLFMFLIYYAVSALTGLIWKSAVISVVITVLFWIACFVVDLVHGVMEGAVLEQLRITRIVEADGALLTVCENGNIQVWDDEASAWRAVSDPQRGRGIPFIDGPYYHAPSKHLLLGQGFRNPFGGSAQRVSLRVGGAGEGWKLRDGPAVPTGTAAIAVASDNSILAVASDNVFRFRGDPATKTTSIRFLGMRLPLVGGGEFRPCLSGDRPGFPDPVAVAADPKEPRVAVCAGNDVYLFTQETEGGLTEAARRTLDNKEKEGSAVAVAGDTVVVGREDGKIWLLAARDLSIKKELMLEPQSQPRFIAAARDGSRFAVLFQNRYLWLIDAKTGDARRAPVAAQGQISGLAWTSDRLLLADYANRVVAYDLDKLARERVYRPAMTRSELAYYYLVEPLHTVFPKPRALNKTVQYVLTEKRTTDLGLFQGDLTQQREDLHPWQPVRSGLAFVGLVLLAACVYIERQEF